ncbi:hypothetical protein [Natronobacterium gregoryi]|uniref:hypothetical protein n=1 Tax=Natronobacterium gregoryi TaxID=44930 RepID=UPI0011144812|nr:hypothetical protein [Natronobacterium gregoryi]
MYEYECDNPSCSEDVVLVPIEYYDYAHCPLCEGNDLSQSGEYDWEEGFRIASFNTRIYPRENNEAVIQADIVRGLQNVKWMGSHRAEYIVGQVNATEWTDLLDSSGDLRTCIREAVKGPVDESDVEQLVRKKAKKHNLDEFRELNRGDNA